MLDVALAVCTSVALIKLPRALWQDQVGQKLVPLATIAVVGPRHLSGPPASGWCACTETWQPCRGCAELNRPGKMALAQYFACCAPALMLEVVPSGNLSSHVFTRDSSSDCFCNVSTAVITEQRGSVVLSIASLHNLPHAQVFRRFRSSQRRPAKAGTVGGFKKLTTCGGYKDLLLYKQTWAASGSRAVPTLGPKAAAEFVAPSAAGAHASAVVPFGKVPGEGYTKPGQVSGCASSYPGHSHLTTFMQPVSSCARTAQDGGRGARVEARCGGRGQAKVKDASQAYAHGKPVQGCNATQRWRKEVRASHADHSVPGVAAPECIRCRRQSPHYPQRTLRCGSQWQCMTE